MPLPSNIMEILVSLKCQIAISLPVQTSHPPADMPRSAARAPLALIHLDPTARSPLFRQVFEGLRNAITDGRLRSGAQLPSARTLAAELLVSRQTVISALDQLRAEGYIESRQRAGTYVSHKLPDDLLHATRPARSQRRAAPAPVRLPTSLSARGARVEQSPIESHVYGRRLPARPFRNGLPALDAFPWTTWSRLVARRIRDGARTLGDYGDARGYARLRAAIAVHVALSRAVTCTADQVIVTTGAQQSLSLIATVLLSPGDTVWMEEPGYGRARLALRSAGVTLAPVGVDDEGLDVSAGIATAPGARAAYVTPSHQFPSGVTMSLGRRLALLQWAAREQAWIIEDDYDSEYRYSTRPITALQGLDEAQRVIYVGSFSKTMFPALRIGYLIVPSSLVDAFAMARFAMDRHNATIEQAALADFIEEGHFPAHLRKMRRLYGSRRDALVNAVDELIPSLTLGPSHGGMHVLLPLPEGVDDRAVVTAGAARHLELSPLTAYSALPPLQGGLILGFSAFQPLALRTATAALAEIIGEAITR